MKIIQSTYQPFLTLDYIVNESENKLFDRKSSRIKPSDLAPIISAFPNAEGGTVVIGIDDKTKAIEGLNALSSDQVNDLVSAPKDTCIPMPQYHEEFLTVTNKSGKTDKLLLLHIEASHEQVIRTINGSTYLRVADRTKELKGDDLRILEYSKNVRRFEDECNPDATIDDLDTDLLDSYMNILNAKNMTYEQLLNARGFMRKQNGKAKLTNAAVLLFAKNIIQFYPNCRIRFIRYDGTKARTGEDLNLDNIKETRYSRNPRIARILTDFGWVRELNEGVKRIYSDMEKYFLDDPVYSEPGQSVRLVLKNNIVMRNLRRKGRALEFIGEDLWAKLDDVDHEILAYLASNIKVRKSELVGHTRKSSSTISSHLKTLVDNGFVKPNGGLHDPGRTYSIITKDYE